MTMLSNWESSVNLFCPSHRSRLSNEILETHKYFFVRCVIFYENARCSLLQHIVAVRLALQSPPVRWKFTSVAWFSFMILESRSMFRNDEIHPNQVPIETLILVIQTNYFLLITIVGKRQGQFVSVLLGIAVSTIHNGKSMLMMGLHKSVLLSKNWTLSPWKVFWANSNHIGVDDSDQRQQIADMGRGIVASHTSLTRADCDFTFS